MSKANREKRALHLDKLESVIPTFETGMYKDAEQGFITKLGVIILRVLPLPGGIVDANRVARALNALDAWERSISSPTPAARACKCDTCKQQINNPEDITPAARI